LWNSDFWGEASCRPEYCEAGPNCNLDAFIKAPVDATSNVFFVIVGWTFIIIGHEDFVYFRGAWVVPKPTMHTDVEKGLAVVSESVALTLGADYSPNSPPNLLVSGTFVWSVVCKMLTIV
jgi:hypothetical protein